MIVVSRQGNYFKNCQLLSVTDSSIVGSLYRNVKNIVENRN